MFQRKFLDVVAFLPQACLVRQNGQQRRQRAGGEAVVWLGKTELRNGTLPRGQHV